ncbi:Cell division protein FtsL [Caloramator mitchellensis]|uniref:Cell division protein FtsL n=1 Tax=Caloramator mitchellensis TaxID=908809 RepID=A0A0R3JT34_CALMK|nr:septum formation initiator family protein [Caloramator mitchellensis]KRQ86678.1 Cell division protein FtsL [Caloramator mitchellensis]
MKKKKRILWFIIFFIFGSIFIKQSIIMYRLNKQYKQYSKQLEKTKLINAQLKDKLNEAKSEDHVEKLAREKLGLVKPGEILFIDKNRKR